MVLSIAHTGLGGKCGTFGSGAPHPLNHLLNLKFHDCQKVLHLLWTKKRNFNDIVE
jgi:hypothetical protein